MSRRALRLHIDALGEQHEVAADARLLLGDVLLARGQRARASQEYAQSVRTYEQTLGPKHPRLSAALLKLALAQETDDPAASEASYAGAAAIAEHNSLWAEAGRAHFGVARMLGRAQGEAARKRADAALQAFGRAPGDHSEERDKVQAWLADLG